MISNLTAISNQIVPAVWLMDERARKEGIDILLVEVRQNYVNDNVELVVVHKLFDRCDADDNPILRLNEIVAQRISNAIRLLHRSPQSKAVSLERRRLAARGEKSAKAKPRKVVA